MVDDVLPWEQMKLRMLNGSHSFLAYLGYLAGYAHISDCMNDTHFRDAARQLMLREQAPTLRITGVDLTGYADSLITRFANPALKRTPGKLPWTVARNCPAYARFGALAFAAHGGEWSLLALGVAGWMRYVSGVDDRGQPVDVRDPLAEKIAALVQSSSEDERRRAADAQRSLR